MRRVHVPQRLWWERADRAHLYKFYRECPTCRGWFGRGKGKNDLARHYCDSEAYALHQVVKDLKARLQFVRLVGLGYAGHESDFARAVNLRVKTWRRRGSR